MPRPKKHIKASKANGEYAGNAMRLTPTERTTFKTAPPLTLSAPKRFTCARGATAREMKLSERAAWRYVTKHFDDVPLTSKKGDYYECTDDYGALRALMTFQPHRADRASHGIKFMGTPSYDKKGRSKEHEAVTHKPHRELLAAVFQSLASTPEMQLISPRVGFISGVETGWHSDANTRGAHPNAMRPLETGGGLLLYHGVQFRCSLMWFDTQLVIPLDINMVEFRYVSWPGDGQLAVISSVPSSEFWDKIVFAPDGPLVVGSIGCCIVSFNKGLPLTCPLDYADIRKTSTDLDQLTLEQALQHAQANPIELPATLWQVIGDDPDHWDVFFGWKTMHCYIGDPWIRRVHTIGCPLRQNGSGQNRHVSDKPDRPLKPLDPKRVAIRNLMPGDVIWVNREPMRVVEVEDAVHISDMRVKVDLNDLRGGGEPVYTYQWLGTVAWELDPMF